MTWKLVRCRPAFVAALLALALATARAVHAQEGARDPGTEEGTSRRNSLGLFTGITLDDDKASFTLGLDYERRLSRQLGVGVLFDRAFDGERIFLVAPALFWHPVGALRLDAAPGVEVNQGDEDEFVFRIAADYDFELTERWSVAPNVNLDFVSGGRVWVLGAEIAYRF